MDTEPMHELYQNTMECRSLSICHYHVEVYHFRYLVYNRTRNRGPEYWWKFASTLQEELLYCLQGSCKPSVWVLKQGLRKTKPVNTLDPEP